MQPTKASPAKNEPQAAPKTRPDGTPVLPDTGEELGEGNRTAAKRYNAGVKETLETKDVEELAEEAANDLDGPEGQELREAEEQAKKGPKH